MKPLTDRALVRRYQHLSIMQDRAYRRIEEIGLADMRPSDMRALNNPPAAVRRLLSLFDQQLALRAEAERRYGPGLIVVNQLIWK